MRPLTSKSKLKNCLGVEQSLRTLTHPDVIMLDGCALLWYVYWPASGTMGIVVQIMVEYLQKRMDYTDVFPVFDRHHPYSRKGSTWIQRPSESAKQQLYFNTQRRPFHLNMFHWPQRKQCTNYWYNTSKSNPSLHFQENRCQRRLGSHVQTIFPTKGMMACLSKAWNDRQSWRSWCCYH